VANTSTQNLTFGSIAAGRGNGSTANTSDLIIAMSKHKLPSNLMAEQVMKRDLDVLIRVDFGVTNQAIHFFIGNFPLWTQQDQVRWIFFGAYSVNRAASVPR